MSDRDCVQRIPKRPAAENHSACSSRCRPGRQRFVGASFNPQRDERSVRNPRRFNLQRHAGQPTSKRSHRPLFLALNERHLDIGHLPRAGAIGSNRDADSE